MQAGKKYVASDGYEFFMCPFTEFKVTQGEDVGTHRGTRAVDFASGTAGYRAPYYAPATVVCVMTVPSSGQAMWRTVNKVHCPNGYFGIVTFVTVHDDSFDAYVGLQVPQGNQLGNMGTKGNATGVHCHLELIQASMGSGNWYQNGYGVWTFNGTESFVDDTFYVDDTNIIYGGAGNWRKTGSTGTSGGTQKYVIEEEHYAVRFTFDQIRIRKDSPDGEAIGYVNAGDEVEYFAKTVYNGHRWVRDKNNYWYAISNSEERGQEMWCELIDPSEMKVNQQPTPDPEPEPPEEEPEKPEFPESVKMVGIDVSEHNADDIDFTLYDFVILRANWWTTTDKKFDQFADKLEELGIPYGVYCYDYCGDEASALEQAKYTYNLIKDCNIQMGVWMDMEDADGWKSKNGYLTKEHCSMVCKVFCDFFKAKGYFTGVYSTKYWFETYCPTNYPKWVANWGTNDGTCQDDFADYGVMHQYTSYGGIDKNVAYHDLDYYKSDPIVDVPDTSADPDQPEEGESIDGGLVNKLVKLLIKLVNKLLSIFK